ncbi:30S ribosomal protein S20 [Clostridium tagluense]|uniref:Small ribosomal subunit protein bS20 n=1 Tax=Clostridium tagluense TaxID=360422 RepID=A0A401UHX0_9CLOT|nr:MULTISPECIES: 30S ribosomal protein S20 [Clostridium]MBU3128441.1 30S ribosomal protein S20 [Clostridium tagluense]MBW9155053.1 30S ribosomal protein S20 [Clostridium tagluense]MBZ9624665.1 30S ribosomal protein S20 [Clostridium sp. FP2]MCB2297279.1 30S ribosomal protein S20 [Clostridium tagluense]MCB2313215.1 30S ribosomal protein S20 [Clostridium tagluense]
MANIKSAKKRIKVTEVKTLRNTMIKSALKTKVKKFETAVVTGNVEEAKTTYANVVKALDMAVTKGILHINKAARRKSRLAAKLNNLSLTA